MGPDRRISRLLAVAAVAVTVGLAGCGRKGPLEAPPSASIAQPQAVQPPPSLGEPDQPSDFGRRAETSEGASSSSRAQAPPPKKSTPLDWLLN